MVKSYKRKVGTFRGITRNDPYLRSKIDLVEEKEKIFKLGELLDHHDIDNDVVDNHQAMDSRDVFLRIVKIGEKLQDMFPDGVVPSNFSTAYPKEYAEVLFISQRLGCESPTVFLEANGFVRNKGGEGRTYSGKMSLSERDLFYYGFIEDELTDEVVKKYDIEPISVENNIALYRDLIGRRQDSSKKRFEQQKEQ